MNEALIAGAGISGLVCAHILEENGVDCRLFEASDAIGGRIRTDRVDGYLLDRGFQALSTAYPNTRACLDFEALKLRKFVPGAIVRLRNEFLRISDPFRDPIHAFSTLVSPVGTMADKIRIMRLRLKLASQSPADLLAGQLNSCSSEEWLKELGFSEKLLTRFFRPFYGAIFLERGLGTAASFCSFMFKMFSEGDTVIPEKGMGEIPRQVAARLKRSEIRLRTRVRRILDRGIELENGQKIYGKYIVVATGGTEVCRLLERPGDEVAWRSTATVYFEVEESPIEEPILAVNGEPEGWVNTLVPLTLVSPSYSETGRHLIAVNTIGVPARGAELIQGIKREMQEWFGSKVRDWKPISTYCIEAALPAYEAGSRSLARLGVGLPPWLKVCGDQLSIPAIEGAVSSAITAAEEILRIEGKGLPIRRLRSA